MALRKRAINDAMSKSKAIGTAGDTVPLPTNNQQYTTEHADSSWPQGATASVQPPKRHDDQLLKMLTDIKEKMKEQQA